MTAGNVLKVHAFKVENIGSDRPLQDVCDAIQSEALLAKRNRTISHETIRVDEIRQQDKYWLLDFIKMRKSNGPGKVGNNTRSQGFSFGKNEAFSEHTAALFDPVSGYILIQYNHHGARAGVIADYFSQYQSNAGNQFLFHPKYQEDVERRLEKQTITTRVELTIDATQMTAQDRKHGTALSEAIDLAKDSGADKITVEISSKSGGKLGSKAREWINSVLNLSKRNPDAVSKLRVSGKTGLDQKLEVLDLIADRLVFPFNDLKIGSDLRYPLDARWDALIRAQAGLLKKI